MATASSPILRIRSLGGKGDEVDYRRGSLAGKCLPLVSTLDVGNLPWDTAPGTSLTPEPEEILCVKRSRTRSVLTFTVSGIDGRPVRLYAKRCRARRGLKRLFSWARRSKSRREWELAWRMLDADLPVAFPLLWADHRRWGLLVQSYLVTLGLEHTVSFHAMWLSLPDREERMCWLRGLGRFIHHVHEKGFAHDDLSTEHVLVTSGLAASAGPAEPKFYFIDLDQSRLGPGPVRAYRRAHNFYQIFRSLPADLLETAERRAFFEGYSDGRWTEEHVNSLEETINLIALQKRAGRYFRPRKWFKKRR